MEKNSLKINSSLKKLLALAKEKGKLGISSYDAVLD